jgi:hypothetical protein
MVMLLNGGSSTTQVPRVPVIVSTLSLQLGRFAQSFVSRFHNLLAILKDLISFRLLGIINVDLLFCPDSGRYILIPAAIIHQPI